MTNKKAKRSVSRQRTKGHVERVEDVKYGNQLKMKGTHEQRQHGKEINLCEKYEDDLDEILTVALVNNEDCIEDDKESNNDVSETDSYCRHCLRPQSELQLRYMRPRQRKKLLQQQHAKRERSKQRFSSYCVSNGSGKVNTSIVSHQAQKVRSKKPRSKIRAKRARNSKYPSCSSSSSNNNKSKINNNKEQHLKLPLIRDLNAANEQAIRFRCPQVGPQVGRDRQMPPMLHFHHPQHVQKQLTAYQVQHTHVYGQHLQQERFGGQQVISPMQTTTLTIESELQQQQPHHLHHLYQHHRHHLHHLRCHQHNERLSNHHKSNKNQQQQHETTVKDSTNSKNLLQSRCSSSPQQNQQTTGNQCPHFSSDYKQQITSCCCYCSCSTTSMVTTTMQCQQHHSDQHQYSHHQQHHNSPRLPLTHPDATSNTAVASLDATTLVVKATTTCTNSSIPSQVLAPSPLPPSDEQRNQNLNNPTANEEDPSHLAVATTPDSPSLVKVSTWYTVAKQGVSC